MTDPLDSVATVLLAGVLNAMFVARVSSSQPPRDGAFLARVYVVALLLLAALAVLLNAFAADSAFAATFWGDSGTYAVAGVEDHDFVFGEAEDHDLVYSDEPGAAKRA